MSSASSNPYQHTHVMTASAGELRLMLIDGAIGAAGMLQEAMQRKDHEQVYLASKKCRELVMELATGLDASANPELCGRLESLYLSIYQSLVAAIQESSTSGLKEVIELLTYDRQTWAMAIENAEREKNTQADELAGGGCNIKC